MGLNVLAVSRAKRIPCDGDENVCDWTHYEISDLRNGKDRLRGVVTLSGRAAVRSPSRSETTDATTAGAAPSLSWPSALNRTRFGTTPGDTVANPSSNSSNDRRSRVQPSDRMPRPSSTTTSPPSRARRVGPSTIRPDRSPVPLALPGAGESSREPHINRAGVLATEELARALGGTVIDPQGPPDLAWIGISTVPFGTHVRSPVAGVLSFFAEIGKRGRRRNESSQKRRTRQTGMKRSTISYDVIGCDCCGKIIKNRCKYGKPI